MDAALGNSTELKTPSNVTAEQPTAFLLQPGTPVLPASATPAGGPAQFAVCLPPDGRAVLAGHSLSAGATHLYVLLHDTAVRCVRRRGDVVIPTTVTMHLPQEILAMAAEYSSRHIRRLLPELVNAELLAWGPHASLVRDMGLYDGCLWAVKLQPGGMAPQLHREDWRRPWRNFTLDIDLGRTVKAVRAAMSELPPQERKEAALAALDAWAVIPCVAISPDINSSDMAQEVDADVPLDIRQVAYCLGDLRTVHPEGRAQLVGRLAGALSGALHDTNSHSHYCNVIWNAWKEEVEGRGGLQVLATILERLDTDIAEWPDLRNPAALMVSRLPTQFYRRP